MTLTDFLLARIADDEEVARKATLDPWSVSSAGVAVTASSGSRDAVEVVVVPDDFPDDPDIRHIARHDPARVLAECEAKRRIVEHFAPMLGAGWEDVDAGVDARFTLAALALPHADHPDYREEWRP